LLLDAQDWEAALALIDTHARALIGQGRTQTVETWIQALPESLRMTNPWTSYWLGLCRLVFVPAEARAHFERAFAQFEQQSDATPLYLAWSGIVDSFVIELHDFTPLFVWLDRYRTLAEGRTPPTPEIQAASIFTYVTGLIWGRFDDPDLPAYVERAERLLDAEHDPDRRFLLVVRSLIPYYLWSGDIARFYPLINSIAARAKAPDSRPLMRLSWYAYYAVVVGGEEALSAVNEGLALADSSGVHALDHLLAGFGIWGQLCVGNVSIARALLKRIPIVLNGGHRESHYRQYLSLVYLHEGDTARAVKEGQASVDFARKGIGIISCLIGLAYARACQGETDMALKHIADAHDMAVRARARLFEAFARFAEAYVRHLRGECEQTLSVLREALVQLRHVGAVTAAYCPRPDAAHLYALALEHNIEPDYVRATIAKTNLPPPPGVLPERWPWRVRIVTFGFFAVSMQDVAVSLDEGKQGKPMELLRALIALGGRNVPVQKLAHALWPLKDGDMAIRAVETNLHRLRRIIGEWLVLRHGNHLSLNADYCWIDLWAFERLITEDQLSLPTREQAEHILALYRGPFLGDDIDAPWGLAPRERLRAKFLRVIARLADALEAQNENPCALLERSLEAEPLAEEIYQHLMRYHLRREQPTEALGVYERCRKTLAAVAQTEPSAGTQALHTRIRGSR